MISHEEFKRIDIEDIVEDKNEILMFSDWEFMDDIWTAKTYGFTEFLKHEENPDKSQSISLSLEELERGKIEEFFKKLGLSLRPGMTIEEIEKELGKPKAVESFVPDRKSYEFITGDEDKYYLSCTLTDKTGLSYLVIMNHEKTIKNLENSAVDNM